MTQKPLQDTASYQSSLLNRMLHLSMLEGGICLIALFFIPVGSGTGSFLAFSPIKLFLIGLAVALIGLLFRIYKNPARKQSIVAALMSRPMIRFLILTGGALLIIFIGASLRSLWLLYHSTAVFQWIVVFRRLLPLMIWIALLALQSMLLILMRMPEKQRESLKLPRLQRAVFLSVLVIGLTIFSFVLRTRTGLVKENAFFGKPTVPLLEWHLVLGLILCILTAPMLQTNRSSQHWQRWLPWIIWITAAGVWLMIPNQHGFFSPAGRPPNFEIYPFSDGSFYGHYARSLAAGMGYKGADIPPRPLYILLLALFHTIAGNQYDAVIFLQTLGLALMPVLLYRIGKELHGVPAGIMAAVLYILRETNAILSAPFAHNVSSTKYFFADLPTALAGMFFILMLLRWIRSNREFPQNGWQYSALSGGALGIMTLIRTQSLVLALLTLFVLFFTKRQRFSTRILQIALFFLTLVLTLSPWLIRNQQITGKFVFDHPATQTAEMTASYNLGKLDMSREPGMNDGDYSDKLQRVLRESIKKYPKEIFSFVSAHFLNGEISALRVFPLRDSLKSARELLRPSDPFWEELGNDDLRGLNLFWFFVYFLIVAWGIAAACGRTSGLAGGLPLFAFLLFNFSTAIGRYSAGRYLIPVDWVLFLYFAVGCADWVQRALNLSGFQPNAATMPEPKRSKADRFNLMPVIWILITFALVGGLLPLAEKIIPSKLQPEDRATVLKKLELNIEDYQSPDSVVMKAIALYPRYYAPGEGEPESAKQGYGVANYGRLIFLTLAPDNFGTIELVMDTPPEYFPDGATVWLAGEGKGATTHAYIVLVKSPSGEDIFYTGDDSL